jgi:replication factor C subunit 2/4
MLFYGPPGTGKTSTILALTRDLFGPLYRSRLLELNASDERGIGVIREKVKSFAKTTVRETVPGYPCPSFKIVLLDEADSLTGDAQTALRRVMELYARTTRFCLVCNYVSRIIEPLTSRCAKFRFRPIAQPAALVKLQMISMEEGVKLADGDDDALVTLLSMAEGDMRRAITLLQSAHRLGKPISSVLLQRLGGMIPSEVVQAGFDLVQTTDLDAIINFARDKVIMQGFPMQQFLLQFMEILLADPTIPATKKAMLSLRLSQADYLLHDGADELLQLLSLLNYCQTILSSTNCPAFVQ